MSLLMDALKKAEKEKKKAVEEAANISPAEASNRGEVPPRLTDDDLDQAFERHTRETAVVGLTDALPEDAAPPALAQQSELPEVGQEGQGIRDPMALELTLEALPAASPDRPYETPADAASDESPAVAMPLDTAPPVPERQGTAVPSPQPYGTGLEVPFDKDATLPSGRQIRSALNGHFDTSHERSPGTGSGARHAGRPRYLGDTAARVTADTVFAATRRSSASRSIKLGITAIVILGASLAAVSAYLELSTPVAVNLGARAIAQTPMRAAEPPPSVVVSPPPDEGSPARAIQGPAPAETRPPAPQSAEPPPAASVVSAAEPGSNRAKASLAEADPAGLQGTQSAGEQSPRIGAAEQSSSQPRPKPRAIQIARSAAKDPHMHQITEAYRAFRSGAYQRAEALYRAVLAQHPERRDALLGLAAIAARHGQTDQAAGYYRRLLQLDPNDAVANAALFNLQGGSDREVSEARLKLLLDQKPKAPDLSFSLGNLYAKQGRWDQAQQAYFDAYAGDGRNPDYMFNLAVSLDRLGQGKTALVYYRKAVDLAARQAVNFNTSQALARIQTLSTLASTN